MLPTLTFTVVGLHYFDEGRRPLKYKGEIPPFIPALEVEVVPSWADTATPSISIPIRDAAWQTALWTAWTAYCNRETTEPPKVVLDLEAVMLTGIALDQAGGSPA